MSDAFTVQLDAVAALAAELAALAARARRRAAVCRAAAAALRDGARRATREGCGRRCRRRAGPTLAGRPAESAPSPAGTLRAASTPTAPSSTAARAAVRPGRRLGAAAAAAAMTAPDLSGWPGWDAGARLRGAGGYRSPPSPVGSRRGASGSRRWAASSETPACWSGAGGARVAAAAVALSAVGDRGDAGRRQDSAARRSIGCAVQRGAAAELAVRALALAAGAGDRARRPER